LALFLSAYYSEFAIDLIPFSNIVVNSEEKENKK